MAKNTSITLGSHFDKFIADRIQTLRLMLAEGEKSGFADYAYDKLLRELDNGDH